ncbi:prephenate dehydratase [Methanobrevibacter sp. DSM 116169]|uniref:prephenate dehydratase n=1 Tax=Methanobrevibacter sp. DSM 116169 TaxID=3242727 RepID=UPI0038FC830C
MIDSQIAFLGPEGTFTHEAASKITNNLISYCSIPAVMESIESGKHLKGIVPIENSIEGSVGITLDSLVHNFNLMISGEIILPINHHLLANPNTTFSEITDVYSHQQALAQCQKFISENNLNAHYALSTASAAKNILNIDNAGAIGTSKAAELYGLNKIKSNIQDNDNNQTRFVILSKKDHEITGNDKTSIAFSIFEDYPGQLHEILGIFAKKTINLTKIESRPSKERLGKYIFFVDFLGHRNNDDIKEILNDIKDKVPFLKILGSYPSN